jgi:hypothetical protein
MSVAEVLKRIDAKVAAAEAEMDFWRRTETRNPAAPEPYIEPHKFHMRLSKRVRPDQFAYGG